MCRRLNAHPNKRNNGACWGPRIKPALIEEIAYPGLRCASSWAKLCAALRALALACSTLMRGSLGDTDCRCYIAIAQLAVWDAETTMVSACGCNDLEGFLEGAGTPQPVVPDRKYHGTSPCFDP